MATKDYKGALTGKQIDALPGRMNAVEQKVENFEMENSELVDEDSEPVAAGVYAEDVFWRGDETPQPDSLAAHVLNIESALGTVTELIDDIVGA